MGKTRASFWAVVGVLLLAGCAHKPAMKVANSDQPYRIGREDVLATLEERVLLGQRTILFRRQMKIGIVKITKIISPSGGQTGLFNHVLEAFALASGNQAQLSPSTGFHR